MVKAAGFDTLFGSMAGVALITAAIVLLLPSEAPRVQAASGVSTGARRASAALQVQVQRAHVDVVHLSSDSNGITC